MMARRDVVKDFFDYAEADRRYLRGRDTGAGDVPAPRRYQFDEDDVFLPGMEDAPTDYTPPSRATTQGTDEQGNPILDEYYSGIVPEKRYSPNVRSQETGELVELPEGVNRFEYSTPGPHVPTRGNFGPVRPFRSDTASIVDVEGSEYGKPVDPEGRFIDDDYEFASGKSDIAGQPEDVRERPLTRTDVRNEYIKEFGNPYTMNAQTMADEALAKDIQSHFNQFFGGAIPWGGRMNDDQKKQWDKYYNELKAQYYNRAKDQIGAIEKGLKEVMGTYDAQMTELRTQRNDEQKRLDKQNEVAIHKAKKIAEGEAKRENQLRSMQMYDELKKMGIDMSKPMTKNQQFNRQKAIATWKTQAYKSGQDGVWAKPLIKYINEFADPNGNEIWFWRNDDEGGDYIEMVEPDGTPVTITEFRNFKKLAENQGLSDLEVLRKLNLL
jgi:hypothetical protein